VIKFTTATQCEKLRYIGDSVMGQSHREQDEQMDRRVAANERTELILGILVVGGFIIMGLIAYFGG
jgi:hypothetical protein